MFQFLFDYAPVVKKNLNFKIHIITQHNLKSLRMGICAHRRAHGVPFVFFPTATHCKLIAADERVDDARKRCKRHFFET